MWIYRSNNRINAMSCLTLHTSRIGANPSLQAERIGGLSSEVSRIGASPVLSAWDTLDRLCLDVKDMFAERHLNLSCSLVCSVSEQFFVRVSPQEIQWVTPNEIITYNVEANTEWNII